MYKKMKEEKLAKRKEEQAKEKKDKYKSIAVAKIPYQGLGKAINDRLMRASKF